MKQFTSFWLILFLCFQVGNAQEITENRSISGGSSLLYVAQNYNVTVEDIQELNSDTLNGLRENDVLVIPKSTKNTFSKKQSIKYTVVLNTG